jgi:2-phosphoglycerate kinase
MTMMEKCYSNAIMLIIILVILLEIKNVSFSDALTNNGIKTRAFAFTPRSKKEKPKLVLIGGCTGTGKSTFGMSVALDQGILKCISTDTIRQIMRSFIPKNISPALHRSSYENVPSGNFNDDDPVDTWYETVQVLESSVEGLVIDAIARKQGLVLEGVSISPSRKLIDLWEEGGGVATGCLLTITNEDTHKSMLTRRGLLAGESSKQGLKDQEKIDNFDRIRKIQDEMIKLANDAQWILIEQKIEIDPLEIIANKLTGEENNEFFEIIAANETIEKSDWFPTDLDATDH